jgi:hypothetical protein
MAAAHVRQPRDEFVCCGTLHKMMGQDAGRLVNELPALPA